MRMTVSRLRSMRPRERDGGNDASECDKSDQLMSEGDLNLNSYN